jgi:HEAT repeat protein
LEQRLRALPEGELSTALRGIKAGEDAAANRGAAIAVRLLENPRWVGPIRRLADDPDPGVRAAVASALAALCTPAVYRQLEALAQDRDRVVLLAALPALSEGARRAGFVDQARKLLRALPDPTDPEVKAARDAALAALDPA